MPARICVPLVQSDPDAMLEAALQARDGGADLVEFRLDAIKPVPQDAHVGYLLSKSPLPAVVTCRVSNQGGFADIPREKRLELLKEAVRKNAAYADIEWPDEGILVQERRSLGLSTRIIASFHDFKGVPEGLAQRLSEMESGPADVVKVAVTPASATQSSALLDLYKRARKPRIVIGMGLPGVPTRILGPLYGAEFTFAALTPDQGSAPGQAALDDMIRLFRIRNITADTRILGVLGNPLTHSLSPLLHNTVFRELGIDAVYLPFEITGDPAEFVKECGGEYVMVDILTCGFSSLQTLRDADLDLAIHAHRAGHAMLTRNKKHGMTMLALAKTMRLIGMDQLHIGTIVGKMEGGAQEVIDIEREMQDSFIEAHGDVLKQEWYGMKPVLPVCSGGLHPGHVPALIGYLGKDIVIQSGGGCHGHPGGTYAGAKAMRQAVDAVMNGVSLQDYAKIHKELKRAIAKWGAK